jgi:stress-induced-phosphoprotein 1
MCIELNPSFAKGYSRKAHVQFFMKEFEKAMETYEKGLGFDPANQELKDGVLRCQQQLARFLNGTATEEEIKERQAKAMADPEIQHIMTDPVMQQVLKDCQENPGSAAKHMRNPGIGAKMRKLMTAGIIRMA